MTLHGNNQSEVARVIRKSQPWVNQHLQLLKLIPELQDLLAQSDEFTATAGRAVAKLDTGEQRRLWEHVMTLEDDERSRFWSGSAAAYKAFIAPPADPETEVEQPGVQAGPSDGEAQQAKPRQAGRRATGAGIVIRVQDTSPTSLAEALRAKFSADELAELIKALMEPASG